MLVTIVATVREHELCDELWVFAVTVVAASALAVQRRGDLGFTGLMLLDTAKSDDRECVDI